ncbi:MAG: aldolase catalytic domain-containing protein [Lachnospiraceae bacterium]|nr:aldolase catalytic domain-containing protein [Lachnospiraceae bacterium]
MKELSSLLGYRKEIKVMDVTLRDGGLVNDFFFEDDFVKSLYMTNIRAGVDYMELGYKASKEMFDPKKFGKWKFCNDDDIHKIVGDKNPAIKLAAMADVGRCDYKHDIRDRKNSPLDVIRVATYVNTIPAAIDMIEDAKKKGYEVTCNIMAISNAQEGDIKVALDMLCQSPVDVIYIVDSFGALFPEQIQRIAHLYSEYCTKYNKQMGIHSHNNQQLAFANAIEAIGDGVNWVDASYGGMGRGAGNCSMENLLAFLRNPKYNLFPVIQFIENYMIPLKESGTVWGYDLQYLMTGVLNQHPRTAIAFTKDKRKDFVEFYKEIVAQD